MHDQFARVLLLQPSSNRLLELEDVPVQLIDKLSPEHLLRVQVAWAWGEPWGNGKAGFAPPEATAIHTKLTQEIQAVEEMFRLLKKENMTLQPSDEEQHSTQTGILRAQQGMLNQGNNLFQAGRHPRQASEAKRSFLLHPKVTCTCGHLKDTEQPDPHHVLEAIDGVYNDIGKHVLPLVDHL